METLTLFIDHLYTSNLGESAFQEIENRSFISYNYSDISISGARFTELVFEDVIFDKCIFFGTTLENCLFINCLFIDCKFQFSHFNNCNFELTTWENCKWGFTSLKDSEEARSEGTNNFAFESAGACVQTTTLTMNEFLNLCA
jgi:hypothetical protein